MSLRADILQFVKTDLGGSQSVVIDENTNLIQSGVLDSMGLMRLIDYLEQRVNIRVPDTEVLPDNFKTVAEIEAFATRLRQP
ncbi:MAG TPA: acyl carrier protein [Longimicrobiales bacterium]|nr:acyl carrier protein [Longimicrobiales bacterium]